MKKFTFLLLSMFILTNYGYSQNWNEVIKMTSSDRAANDNFGYTVSISGNYAIVGAYLEDEDATGLNTLVDAGSAYILEIDISGNWVQVQKLVASDRQTIDNFGYSVSMSGDYAIVSAIHEDHDLLGLNGMNDAGSAYIFERNGAGIWNEVQKIVASDRTLSDFFGWDVSISGGYAIVSAKFEDEDTVGANFFTNAGSAYIFERDGGGSWNQVQKIVASDRNSNDLFGYSVAISGNYAIVGAYMEDEDELGLNTKSTAGSAYLFERDGGGIWNQVQKIVASDRDVSDNFSYEVAISGNYAIVGAYGQKLNEVGLDTLNVAGAAYIFERNGGGVWSEAQKIVASDRNAIDFFGINVSIDSNFALVGAYQSDYDAAGGNYVSNSGAAYIYERNGGGTWIENQKIVASDRDVTDNFASSVSIASNKIIVGAYLEDHDVSGGNFLSASGSVYIFKLCMPTTSSITEIACGSYIVPSGDETYTAIGSYTVMDTIPNVEGCDSIITINLTVNPLDDASFSYSAVSYNSTAGNQLPTITGLGGGMFSVVGGLIMNSSTGEINPASSTPGTYTITYSTSGTCPNSSDVVVSILADLVISEIMYNSPEAGTDTLEFIEIYNNGSTAVDVTNYTCTGGIYTFPSVSIPSGGYYVIAINSVAFNSVFGFSPDGQFTSGLSNAGESIVLKNSVGIVIDSVSYSNSAPWPFGTTAGLPNGGGASLILCNANSDNNDGNNWNASIAQTGVIINGFEVLASPGVANFCCTNTTATVIVNVCFDGSYNYADGTVSNNIVIDESYVSTIPNVAGCDSIITENLTVLPAVDVTITNTAPTLTANQAGASYRWLDCDNANAIIPLETAQSFTATANGNYAVEVTVGSCMDTSACENITGVGIKEAINTTVSIYPNPNSGLFTISLSNQQGEVNYTITTLEGRIVKQVNNVATNNISVDLSNESKGVYLLRINEANTNKVYKIVRQ